MGKTSKRTRKFKKEHLTRAIGTRKYLKKKKFRENIKDEKAKARNEREQHEKEQDRKAEELIQKPKVEELDIDSFMEGAFFGNGDDSDSVFEQSDDETEAASKAMKTDDKDGDSDDDDSDDDDDNDNSTKEKAKEAESKDSDDSDDSDDEDEDEDDDKELMDELEMHQAELEKLKETDPEFYAHLKQNDKGLLDIEDTKEADDEIIEKMKAKAAADAAMKEDAADAEEEEVTTSKQELTMKDLKKLKKEVAKDMSLSALKRLVKIFRYACHIGDDETAGDGAAPSATSPIQISNSKVFNDLMRFCFLNVGKVIAAHVGITEASDADDEEETSKKKKAIKKYPRWNSVKNITRSYVGNLLHFLSHVVDPQMTRFVLSAIETSVMFFEPFPKLAQKFLKVLLKLWASDIEQAAKIDAFLRIRQLCLVMHSDAMVEAALKGIYLTYVRNSKFTNVKSLPNILFLSNCVVELYGIDLIASYQHAFVYIRQLAIHLRNAIMAKTAESHKSVYNWQFINCLRVWAKVLALHGASSDSELQPLVYPFVQVCIGVIKLVPSSRYFPLKFQVIRLLNYVCAHTQVYIPIAAHLLQVLDSADLRKRPTQTTSRPPDVRHILHVSPAHVTTKAYQEQVLSAALSLLMRHLACYSYSISFPELIIPCVKTLRKFRKTTKIVRVKKQVQQLVNQLQANAEWIKRHRADCNLAPKDMAAPFSGDEDKFKAKIVAASKNAKAAKSPLERIVELQGDDQYSFEWSEKNLPTSNAGMEDEAVGAEAGGDDEESEEEADAADDQDEAEAMSDDDDEDDDANDEVQDLVLSDDEE